LNTSFFYIQRAKKEKKGEEEKKEEKKKEEGREGERRKEKEREGKRRRKKGKRREARERRERGGGKACEVKKGVQNGMPTASEDPELGMRRVSNMSKI